MENGSQGGVDPLPEPGTKAHDMLVTVIEFMRREGRVDLSLRQIAAAVGTSHRMLGYYFGTREELLGVAMRQLSADYIAKFADRYPRSRVESLTHTWEMFHDPNNRLQTQLLFTLMRAAADRPNLKIPALTSDLDNFTYVLTLLGTAEGLEEARAKREARLIVATLLGLYLDFFITQGSPQVDESYEALIDWVTRSSAGA